MVLFFSAKCQRCCRTGKFFSTAHLSSAGTIECCLVHSELKRFCIRYTYQIMWLEIPFVWSTPQCMQHWFLDSFQGLLWVHSRRVAQVYQLGLDDRDDREPLVFLEGPEHLYCGHSFCRHNNAVSISTTIIINWILPISMQVHHLGMMGVVNPLMRIFRI